MASCSGIFQCEIRLSNGISCCDEKRTPSCELIPYYGSHDTSLKIRKQMQWSSTIKQTIWTEIVSEKIRKQMQTLEYFDKEEARLIRNYLEEITLGDSTNREGHSAKVYFNALFGRDFSRNSESVINSALNYGYAILLSAFNREIVANGYLTQIGLFHDNMFNSFNLASDFMEPFRCIVDRKVYQMKPVLFEHTEKMMLVDLLNSEVRINNRNEIVNNAIKIYCKSIFDALEEKDVSLIRFYNYEL